MRGSSLKSPSQNRTCPIKAYGSSISHLPNKHFSGISSDTPTDVTSRYPCISAMSANKSGLCVFCFSIVLPGHTYNTFAILYNSRISRNICNVRPVSHLTLQSCRLCSRAYAPISISLWLHVSFSASSCLFYAVHSTYPSGLLHCSA